MRPALTADLSEGVEPGTREAVALLDRLATTWTRADWHRAARVLADLVRGPIGFTFEAKRLTLAQTQTFMLELRFEGKPVRSPVPLAVRGSLHGVLYRPVQ